MGWHSPTTIRLIMTIKPLLLLFLVCITASRVLAQANTAENIILKGIVIDKENSKALGRVGKGISAQASHRTVREALTSYGSYYTIKRV